MTRRAAICEAVRRPALAVLLAAASALAPSANAAQPPLEWNFRVLLDGAPIGQHRFRIDTASVDSGAGSERTVVSDADFAVRILGIAVYRYRHSATEQWRGDCLRALSSTTDDDGKLSRIETDRAGPLNTGCMMSFAYWNPAIRQQTRLLNAQTGQVESVRVERAGTGTVEMRGEQVAATRFRIVGAAQPIDVWYSAGGDWIGLDAIVGGSRKLSYRLP